MIKLITEAIHPEVKNPAKQDSFLCDIVIFFLETVHFL